MLALCCYNPWKRDRYVIKAEPPQLSHLPVVHDAVARDSIALQQLTGKPGAAQVQTIEEQFDRPKSCTVFESVPLTPQQTFDEEEEDLVAFPKRNSNALEAVKTKLIRHISFERSSDNRTSVGNSEEEVARRAELRQIRNKRIQDELSSDDGQCVSTHTSIRSTKYLSPYIDIGQPGNGPRDAIEFTMDSDSYEPSQLCPPPVPSPASDPNTETSQLMAQKKRRSSCPSAFKTPEDQTKPTESEPCLDVQDVSRPQSVHCSASTKMTALTFPSPPMERVLGAENSFQLTRESNTSDSTSGLGMWLIAQALHDRDSALQTDEQGTITRKHLPLSLTPPQDFGGIDSIVEKPVLARKKDSMLFRTRRSSVPCPSKLQLSTQSSQLSTREEISRADIPYLADKGSSCYPSGMASFQPSPAHSQPYINVLSNHDLESLELSPFEWHDRLSIFKDPGPSEDRSSYNTAEESRRTSPDNLSSPTVVHLPATAEPNTSSSQSEAASYYEREVELLTIPKRFAAVLSNPKPPQNYKTRFKETFEGAMHGRSQRHSFMSKFSNEVQTKSSHEKGQARNLSLNGPSALRDFISGTLPIKSGTVDDLAIRSGQVREHPLSVFKETSYQKRRTASNEPEEHRHSPKSTLRKFSEYAGRRRHITPAESWARYPSHTRSERTQRAGQKDEVSSRDFAIKRVFSDGRVQWFTDQNQPVLRSRTGLRATTFPVRLGSAVRSGFNKLLTPGDETVHGAAIAAVADPSCASSIGSTPDSSNPKREKEMPLQKIPKTKLEYPPERASNHSQAIDRFKTPRSTLESIST